jgi:hypothetical protein
MARKYKVDGEAEKPPVVTLNDATVSINGGRAVSWAEFSGSMDSALQQEEAELAQRAIDALARKAIARVSDLDSQGQDVAPLDRARQTAAYVVAKCNWVRLRLAAIMLCEGSRMEFDDERLQHLVRADFDIEDLLRELSSEMRKLGSKMREAIRAELPEETEEEKQGKLFNAGDEA